MFDKAKLGKIANMQVTAHGETLTIGSLITSLPDSQITPIFENILSLALEQEML